MRRDEDGCRSRFFHFVCVLLEFRLDVFITALALVCMMGITELK